MNRKMKKVMAFILSLALVCSSFLEFVVPAKAAETGFAENAVIVSDTAPEYCWNETTVNLSVVVLNGTAITWSADRTDGITITEGDETDDIAGKAKHLAVAIDSTASGSYKITANAGNDSRTITLNVYNSLSDIQGAVVTDFLNQYTDKSFEVKVVVNPKYAEEFQWASADDTKVEIKPLEEKTDTTTYPGSVVKYAQVNIKSEKPEDGICDITATANSIVKSQMLMIRKSATNMKDLAVTATSYQEKDPNFDLGTYNHMSSDTVYVDMGETITISAVVEGTLVNPEKEAGAALSALDIDDLPAISSSNQKEEDENSSTKEGNISILGGTMKKISDTSYSVEWPISGVKATEINEPLQLTVFTASGKVAINKKLVVLAPAQNTIYTVTEKDENGENVTRTVEEDKTQVGLCKKGNLAGFNIKDYNVIYKLDNKNVLTKVTNNIAWQGEHMIAGDTIELSAIFRSRFDLKKKYICNSTDTPVWKSADETIATVTQDGVVKAVKGGNTTIYCYAAPTKTSPRSEIFATYNIYVTDLTLADNINITKSVKVGEKEEQQVIAEDTIYTYEKNIQYAAQLVDGDKTANEKVTWASTDEGVFTVDKYSGIVNPVAAGTANLIATSVNSGLQAFIPIKVIAAVETVKIVEEKATTNYVQGHIYGLSTDINEGADPNEELTWTVENTDENDPVVVFIDPNDSEKKELTSFVGRYVNVLIKKRGSATVTVKGAYNVSAIDNLIVTGVAARTAVYTHILYNNSECEGQELTVNKGTNVDLMASLKDETKFDSTDDFQWNIIQKGEVVKTTNDSLVNAKNLTLQPLTKGDVTIELRNLQTNKLLTVTLHVKVPATDISLKESQENEIMLVPGEVGETGVTYQLKPILTPEDTSDTVIYESSNPSIVKVDENGLLTAVKSSETPVTITAKINDTLKATCQARVAIPVKELKAEDADGNTLENNGVIRVYKGETAEVKLNCGNATEYIDWTSANERVASVKPSDDKYTCTINGNVAGQTILTAASSVSKKTMRFTIKVVNRITSMVLGGSNTIALNATNGYVSVTLPANSDDVIWSVDNSEIVDLTPMRNQNTARVNLTPKKVGKAVITAMSADGACVASKEIEVTALNLSAIKIVPIEAVTYDGTEQKPKLTVTLGNATLVEGEDYIVTYSNNISVGTAKIILSEGSSGNYVGTKTFTFKITQRDINNVQATKINDVPYTAAKVTPAVTITDLGKTLVKDTDYTATYVNNVNAGTATVTIRGKGNYSGTKTITFNIVPQNISKVKVTKIADQKYTGKAILPALTVTNGTTKMSANRDYTVTYSSNKNPGKAKAVIKGTGNYTGSKTVYFYIAPAKAKLTTATSTSAKSMKLKWKKDSKATGYEIYYATKANFSKSSRKVVTISKNKTTSKTMKNLKSNKTYYVKIRSYKKVGSKKIYGDWSNTLRVAVK